MTDNLTYYDVSANVWACRVLDLLVIITGNIEGGGDNREDTSN